LINYNHLYYFHVTASEGSIARAAERLGVGQPTVSEQVRQLERTLGTPLFERGGKLRLTEAGRQAFEHTSIMFRAGERLVKSLLGAKNPPPLLLRVGISVATGRTIATDFLLPVLALDDCIPAIRTGEVTDLMRDLRARDLELVLCETDPGEIARPNLQMVPIQHGRLVAITSASADPHPRWEDVALVTYRPSSPYRHAVDTYLDERELMPRIAAETDDALVMLAAVERGGFVAFVPSSIARDAIAATKVRILASIPSETSIYALFHDAESATAARRAVELLVECAKSVDDGSQPRHRDR
jgi:LysR family transcriptional regulator, transcriptional activator of nhaA